MHLMHKEFCFFFGLKPCDALPYVFFRQQICCFLVPYFGVIIVTIRNRMLAIRPEVKAHLPPVVNFSVRVDLWVTIIRWLYINTTHNPNLNETCFVHRKPLNRPVTWAWAYIFMFILIWVSIHLFALFSVGIHAITSALRRFVRGSFFFARGFYFLRQFHRLARPLDCTNDTPAHHLLAHPHPLHTSTRGYFEPTQPLARRHGDTISPPRHHLPAHPHLRHT